MSDAYREAHGGHGRGAPPGGQAGLYRRWRWIVPADLEVRHSDLGVSISRRRQAAHGRARVARHLVARSGQGEGAPDAPAARRRHRPDRRPARQAHPRERRGRQGEDLPRVRRGIHQVAASRLALAQEPRCMDGHAGDLRLPDVWQAAGAGSRCRTGARRDRADMGNQARDGEPGARAERKHS